MRSASVLSTSYLISLLGCLPCISNNMAKMEPWFSTSTPVLLEAYHHHSPLKVPGVILDGPLSLTWKIWSISKCCQQSCESTPVFIVTVYCSSPSLQHLFLEIMRKLPVWFPDFLLLPLLSIFLYSNRSNVLKMQIGSCIALFKIFQWLISEVNFYDSPLPHHPHEC